MVDLNELVQGYLSSIHIKLRVRALLIQDNAVMRFLSVYVFQVLEAVRGYIYVTGSGKTSLQQIFTNNINYQIRNQNQLGLSGLFLLVAFPSIVMIRMSSLELWPAWGWLYVAVQLRGIE